jgi:2,3-bisphosphoglycerate-independent phosphoglycerate mutase
MLMRTYPNTLLAASGEAVGLPEGYQGNSEVGHLTMGIGRIPYQPMVRIDHSIQSREFFKNKAFQKAVKNCKKHKSRMHLIGLLQTEGVHAKSEHLYALIDMCRKQGIDDLVVHVITDGRDAPPTAGALKVEKLAEKLGRKGKIATISGRYYAMDRDKRWDRTEKAYKAIIEGEAPLLMPIKECYKKGETDEFLIPRKAEWYLGAKENDSIIFYNFRTDRTRQLTKAVVEEKFDGFFRKRKKVCFVGMTEYYRPMNALVAFEHEHFDKILGEVLSKHNKRQLRISETEKYAHVTFFFNAENEVPFKGEDRILVPSPKVATYDKKPEMSAFEITEKAIQAMDKYDLVIMNIVNGDMVGHTGVKKACLKAVNVVDQCVEKIIGKVLMLDGTAIVLADHGNIEDQTRKWRTSHTLNPVPLIVVSKHKYQLRKEGGLSDVAPTILSLLSIKQPKEMTGKSLL